MQTNTEPLALLCAGFFGAVLYLRLVWMFGQAALRGVFFSRLGEIVGKPARLIGFTGLLGLFSFAYLALGISLNIRPPFWPLAGFFLALAVLMVFGTILFAFLSPLWQRR